MINFDSIRARHSLTDYLARIGWSGKRSGSSIVGKCPLHQEVHGASFAVYPDEGRWQCYGKCGCFGDIIDLERLIGGGTLVEAATRLNGGELPTTGERVCRVIPKRQTPYILASTDRERMMRAAEALAHRPERFYEAIGERPEILIKAIRSCALDGDLGIEDSRLLFGYGHGIKARWRVDGERHFSWLCGAAHGQCWRQSLLARSYEIVLITEGETDCLHLLSLNTEEPGKVLALALASASTFPSPEPFTGRRILYFPDPDPAGQKACEKLKAMLTGYAYSFSALPLEDFIRE
jgi:hypothetical protein